MPRNRDVATVGSRRHHTPKRRYNLVVQAKHSLVTRCGHLSYRGVEIPCLVVVLPAPEMSKRMQGPALGRR